MCVVPVVRPDTVRVVLLVRMTVRVVLPGWPDSQGSAPWLARQLCVLILTRRLLQYLQHQ